MYSSPLFSIVIVNYNHGKYLGQAITSIIDQSCNDFELIIVDGCSTDNSLDIIKKYQERLAWWVSEKDKGQSEAFNKGFKKAKGEYFFWINADDLLLPNALSIAKKTIKDSPNYKWFAGNTIFFDKNGVIKKCASGPKWNSIIFSKTPISVYGPSSIFHKSLFKKYGGFDESLNYTMDGDLWYKFYHGGEKFLRINKYFWGFRVHNESKTSHAFSTAADKRFLEEREKIFSKYNRKSNVFFDCLSIIYKLIAGSYIVSFVDTIKYKGRNINSIFYKLI